MQNSKTSTKSEIATSFSTGKFENCMDYLTDKTVWNKPGEQLLTGKIEIVPYCGKSNVLFQWTNHQIQNTHVIEKDRCVSIDGTAKFIRDGKGVSFISYCDVYEFEINNTIIYVTSYCIAEPFVTA